MKKIIFIITIILLCVSCTVTKQTKSDYTLAQQDSEINTSINPSTGQAIQTGVQESKTEKVTASTAKTKVQEKSNSNYNPYRDPREDYIHVMRSIFDSYKYTDCNEKEVKTLTSTSKSIYYSDTISISVKREAIKNLSRINCQEVIDLFINIINNDTDKELRYDAVQGLGLLRAKSSIPDLLELSKRETELDYINKIALSLCYMEEFDIAASILDKICFNEDGSINRDCVIAYEYAGRSELAKIHWLSEWEDEEYNDEESRFHIAMKLIEHGIYDITFLIIKENLLYSTNKWRRCSALTGLAAIATDEALELIQNCTNDTDIVVANRAKGIMRRLENFSENERSEK